MTETEKQVRYNGLTIADKDALLDAKAKGANYIARDKDNDVRAFIEKPVKTETYWMGKSFNENWWIEDNSVLKFIQWSDTEPVHIDIAIAQVAEMEREQKPRTNQDALIEKWRDVNELAQLLIIESPLGRGYYHREHTHDGYYRAFLHKTKEAAMSAQVAWLLSQAEDGK
jgi:hypothetical protein